MRKKSIKNNPGKKYSSTHTIITVMIAKDASNTASTVASTIFIIYGSSLMLHSVQIWYRNLSKFTPPDKHSQSDNHSAATRLEARVMRFVYNTIVWNLVLGFGLSQLLYKRQRQCLFANLPILTVAVKTTRSSKQLCGDKGFAGFGYWCMFNPKYRGRQDEH